MNPMALSQIRFLTADRPTDAFFFIGLAERLIGQISNLLIDHTNPSNNHREWKPTLDTLGQILFLAERAIIVYNGRPLGQSLTNMFAQELEQCCALLSELHDTLHRTFLGLIRTRIRDMLRSVFRKQWDDELTPLIRRLWDSRNSLGMSLMALNSYVLSVFQSSPLSETTHIY